MGLLNTLCGCIAEAQAAAQASGNGQAFAQATASVQSVDYCLHGRTSDAFASAKAQAGAFGGSFALAQAQAATFSGEHVMLHTGLHDRNPSEMKLAGVALLELW